KALQNRSGGPSEDRQMLGEAPREAEAAGAPAWALRSRLVEEIVPHEEAEQHEIRSETAPFQLEQAQRKARTNSGYAEVEDLDRPASPPTDPLADEAVPHLL